jgi:hypothetical protein
MSRILRSALGAAALGLLVLVLILSASGTPARKAVEAYLLFLGGITLLALVAATSAAVGRERRSQFEDALTSTSTEGERPRDLVRLEREVHLAQANSLYLHVRLRRTLREIATHRLRVHEGIDLDRDHDAARAALGREAWDLLRPDREPPLSRDAPGMELEELRTVVDAVENV